MDDDHKAYLEYLDKEMSIMGVLCAFSVGALAVALDRILGNEKTTILTSLWQHERSYIMIGSILVLGSALMFYRQRSLLAWYYGEIALSLIKPNVTSSPVEFWLKEADSWATWITYRIGWDCLALAVLLFVAALSHAGGYTGSLPKSALWLPIIAWGVVEVVHLFILRAYRYESRPRKRALKDVWRWASTILHSCGWTV